MTASLTRRLEHVSSLTGGVVPRGFLVLLG